MVSRLGLTVILSECFFNEAYSCVVCDRGCWGAGESLGIAKMVGIFCLFNHLESISDV